MKLIENLWKNIWLHRKLISQTNSRKILRPQETKKRFLKWKILVGKIDEKNKRKLEFGIKFLVKWDSPTFQIKTFMHDKLCNSICTIFSRLQRNKSKHKTFPCLSMFQIFRSKRANSSIDEGSLKKFAFNSKLNNSIAEKFCKHTQRKVSTNILQFRSANMRTQSISIDFQPSEFQEIRNFQHVCYLNEDPIN